MRKAFLAQKLLLIALGSWLVGSLVQSVYCYATAKDFILQGVNHGNHAVACAIETAVFGFVIIMLSFPLLYVPALLGLRWVLHGIRPRFIFVIVSTVLYLLPLSLVYITAHPDHWVSALFSSDEFHIILGVSSFMFGLGFVSLLTRYDEQNEQDADEVL